MLLFGSRGEHKKLPPSLCPLAAVHNATLACLGVALLEMLLAACLLLGNSLDLSPWTLLLAKTPLVESEGVVAFPQLASLCQEYGHVFFGTPFWRL